VDPDMKADQIDRAWAAHLADQRSAEAAAPPPASPRHRQSAGKPARSSSTSSASSASSRSTPTAVSLVRRHHPAQERHRQSGAGRARRVRPRRRVQRSRNDRGKDPNEGVTMADDNFI
jgi:hypothetical protein